MLNRVRTLGLMVVAALAAFGGLVLLCILALVWADRLEDCDLEPWG